MILVVVVLVLIALLGAAWLSFARTQRVAIHGTEDSNIDLVMAATVMNVITLIILFIVMQKQLIAGIQLGGVKG